MGQKKGHETGHAVQDIQQFGRGTYEWLSPTSIQSNQELLCSGIPNTIFIKGIPQVLLLPTNNP